MADFPRFRPKQFTQFQKVMHKRVNDFIEDRKLKPTASTHLVVKAVVMFAAYLVPYGILLAFQMPFYIALALWALMGLGMAGIGMNVMHDGLHGSWSKKGWLNRVMGDSIYLLCGNPFTWKVQHNYLHMPFGEYTWVVVYLNCTDSIPLLMSQSRWVRIVNNNNNIK